VNAYGQGASSVRVEPAGFVARAEHRNEECLRRSRAETIIGDFTGQLIQSETKGTSMSKPFTITFCGDTSLGYYYLEKYRHKYPEAHERLQSNPMSFFEGIKPLLEDSDEIIVNLETVLSKNPGEPIAGKEYPGCDDPETTIRVLKELGVTAVTLANNHTMDFGPDRLLAMIDLLEKNAISVIGAGKNIKEARKPYKVTGNVDGRQLNVYILNGMRATKRYSEYGFFAGKDAPGIANTSFKAMSRSIREIRKKDPEAMVVVCPHWQGIDYKDTDEHHREWCRNIIDAGASHVIGHGSHKEDLIEEYNGGTIFYSIGNFIFNSPGRYHSKTAEPYSLIVKSSFIRDRALFSAARITTDNRLTGFQVTGAGRTGTGRGKAVPESKEENLAGKLRIVHGKGEETENQKGMDYSLNKIRPGNWLLIIDGNWSKGRAEHSGQYGKTDRQIVAEARKKGVTGFISSREFGGGGLPVRRVDNTLAHLFESARKTRKDFKGKVIAVTGSAGKSSTVAMIKHALARAGFSAISTQENHNTVFGVSALFTNLDENYDFCIVETALSGFYRYEQHAGNLINPDVAVITSIDLSQPDLVSTSEETAYYKAKLFESLRKDGAAIYCRDTKHSDLLGFIANTFSENVYCYGERKSQILLDSFSVNSDGHATITATLGADRIAYKVPSVSKAMAYNSLAVLAVFRSLGLSVKKAAESLETFAGDRRVLKLYSGHYSGKKITMLDDTKNATLNSVKEALEVFRNIETGGRKILIFGRLVHLGIHQEAVYQKISEMIKESDPDLVLGYGEEVNSAFNFVKMERILGIFQEPEELIKTFLSNLQEDDFILVKGSSRGTGLRKISSEIVRKINGKSHSGVHEPPAPARANRVSAY
jgi:UDP-N-acetylmuramyl pentapeptide synthase/poly-gamma-glutamate capsule biosynthesis protein CapA/YwtB (metallophosphatase superfamily)